MHLSSVRDLKLELAAAHETPAPLLEALGLTRASTSLTRSLDATHTRAPGPALYSLGVASGKSRRDFRLGVRIHARGGEARVLADQLQRKARGEADIRIVPEVRPRILSPGGPLDAGAGARTRPSRGGGAWFQKHHRPLEAGLSVGHYRITAGTLGFVVEDEDAYYVLSNNHVLANQNQSSPGDLVLQPGPADSPPSEKNLIGVLDRFVPISFQRSNVVDCALASILPELEFYVGWTEALPGKLQGWLPVTTDDLDRTVVKVGRTTGRTNGTIRQVEVDRLPIHLNEGVASFSDQVEIAAEGGPFSQGGDSGSLIVDEEGYARGLLFAGGFDEDSELDLTYANGIGTVLKKLGVELTLR